MLQTAWHLPFRKLVLAMPLTCMTRRAGHPRAHRPGLDRVVSGRRPAVAHRPRALLHGGHQPARARVIRHSLNLESGLNDGLALPAVLAFTAAAAARRASSGGSSCCRTSESGLATGLLVACLGLAADAARRRAGRRSALTRRRSMRSGGLRCLRGSRCCPPRATASSRSSSAAIALRDLASRHPALLRGTLGGRDRGDQARRLPGLRRDPHLRLPLRGGWAAVVIAVFTLLIARPVAVFAVARRQRAGRPRRARRSWPGSAPRAWRR